MTEATRIADLIQNALPNLKSGALRLWGQWFGRPYDNIHTITGASSRDELLEVRFDNGEVLRIFEPTGALVCAARFTIGGASRVRWEWNAYGNPPGRRCFEEYVRNGANVDATTDVDWYTPTLRPSSAKPAVEIL